MLEPQPQYGKWSECTPSPQYIYCGSCRLALIDDSGNTAQKLCPVCTGFVAMARLNERTRIEYGLKPFKEWDQDVRES